MDTTSGRKTIPGSSGAGAGSAFTLASPAVVPVWMPASLRDVRLDAEHRELAVTLFEYVRTELADKEYRYAQAALEVLIELREKGPDKYKFRRDRNSTYTHELAQVRYRLWTVEHKDEVLHRVLRLRTSGHPDNAPVEVRKLAQAQLRAELAHDVVDTDIATNLLHDVIEDYFNVVTDEDMAAAQAELTLLMNEKLGLPEDAQDETVASVLHSVGCMTRRTIHDPREGPRQEYDLEFIPRLLIDIRATRCKGFDGLHNKATLLGSGLHPIQITRNVNEAQNRVRMAGIKYDASSPLIAYNCAYETDQIRLLQQYLSPFWQYPGQDRMVMDHTLMQLEERYQSSTILQAIHPMRSIVMRIRSALKKWDGRFINTALAALTGQEGNQSVLESGPAAAPSVQPASGPVRPRRT